MNDNRSVQRCLAVLRSFRGGPGQSLTALSRSVDLPHSTVLRLLNTLQSEGYVRKDSTLWSLTPQWLESGFAALANTGVKALMQASFHPLATSAARTVPIREKTTNEATTTPR